MGGRETGDEGQGCQTDIDIPESIEPHLKVVSSSFSFPLPLLLLVIFDPTLQRLRHDQIIKLLHNPIPQLLRSGRKLILLVPQPLIKPHRRLILPEHRQHRLPHLRLPTHVLQPSHQPPPQPHAPHTLRQMYLVAIDNLDPILPREHKRHEPLNHRHLNTSSRSPPQRLPPQQHVPQIPQPHLPPLPARPPPRSRGPVVRGTGLAHQTETGGEFGGGEPVGGAEPERPGCVVGGGEAEAEAGFGVGVAVVVGVVVIVVVIVVVGPEFGAEGGEGEGVEGVEAGGGRRHMARV